jgi:hypothetical protein
MTTRSFSVRREWLFLLLAVVAGFLFFIRLDRLWPLADMPLIFDREAAVDQARVHLTDRGYDLEGWSHTAYLSLDDEVLDYLETSFGLEGAQERVREGRDIFRYRVLFKKGGDSHVFRIDMHPARGVLSWSRSFEEDDAGASLDVEEARKLAEQEAALQVTDFPDDWESTAESSAVRPDRVDHRFFWERTLSDSPELRERLYVSVAGDQLSSSGAYLVVPGEAKRSAVAAEAPGRALEAVGMFLLAGTAIAGFFVFLRGLKRGSVRLGRAFLLPGIVFVCLMGTYLLQSSTLFLNWEPLWPRWVSTLQYLLYRVMDEAWMLVVLLAVVGAGDALDRERGLGRGDSLWQFARGRLTSPAVGAASLRGFAVGLFVGVTILGAVTLFQTFAGAELSLQPRGFFFYAINSASPSFATLLFFLNVALIEELGYRFFAGTLIEGWTGGGKTLAILVPAIIYGLTHTRLDFLPPMSPWWARAVVLTAVGCVWGWAFFRWDALTVVLSHWTADLFIFNWPRFGAGDRASFLAATATVAVPLLPAIWMLLRYRDTSNQRSQSIAARQP